MTSFISKYNKKKGFTLIELLATIIILAVVAVITIPLILNVIEDSKRESFRNSVSGIIRAVQQHYANDMDFSLDENGLYYTIYNGDLVIYDDHANKSSINYNGSLKNATGQIIVQPDESIYATVDYSKWCAIKRYDSGEIEVYSIKDKEKCHNELLEPKVTLSAIYYDDGAPYISDTWTDKDITLIASTNSIDDANYEYIWYKDGQAVDNSNTNVIFIKDILTEKAEYSVAIKNSQGDLINSDNKVIVKIDKTNPTCKINLSSANEINGWHTGTIIATLDTSSVFSDVKKYGLNIGENASYNSTKELTIGENGKYEVYGIVENALGKSATCYKSVNKDDVTNFTVAINAVLEGTNTVYTSGTVSTSNIVLTGIVSPNTNASGYKYQWYRNNQKITSATDIQYKTTSSGSYYLEVTAGNGTVKKSSTIDVSITNNSTVSVPRPTCSLNVTSGTLGSNNWYTSDVVVGLSKSNATRYGITTSSFVSYNNSTSVTLSSTSNVYCYVSNETGTNSNSKKVNIDQTAPTISSFSGTSVSISGYDTTSLKLTVVASDPESEISEYEFYKVTQSYSEETLMGTSTTGIYTVSNPTNGYNYKVKVYNNAGLVSEQTITESCSLSKTGTCSGTTRTNTYTCTTGRQYGVTTSEGCITTSPPDSDSGGGGGSGFTCDPVHSYSDGALCNTGGHHPCYIGRDPGGDLAPCPS